VSEDNLVQELRDEGFNLSVGESYNRYETGGGIDDGQSFGFASQGLSLALKVHGKTSSGRVVRTSAKEAMGLVLTSFFVFAFGAVGESASGVSPQSGPKVTLRKSFRHFSLSQVEHAVVSETN
jgi:hypothetical protein